MFIFCICGLILAQNVVIEEGTICRGYGDCEYYFSDKIYNDEGKVFFIYNLSIRPYDVGWNNDFRNLYYKLETNDGRITPDYTWNDVQKKKLV